MRFLSGFLAVSVLVSLAGIAEAKAVYLNDDGIPDEGVGLTDGGDFWWVQGFSAPGGDILLGIATYFATMTDGTAHGVVTTDVMTVLLYNDPTDDMDPTDAVLLTSVTTTVGALDTFVTTAITPTAVSGDFFVGVLFTQASGVFPLTMDDTSDQEATWFAGAATPGSFDPSDITGSSEIGPILSGDVGFPGNAMVRGLGTPIPEPATFALFGLGGIALALYGRRRRR